jgi:hypothetical protein
MLVLVVLTFAACVALYGWGRALHILLGLAGFRGARPGASDQALLGMFMLTLLALTVNYFFPLTKASGLLAIGGGIVLAVWPGESKPPSKIFLRTVIVFAGYFAFRIIKYSASYDAGLYHVPYLNWMAQFPLPIGLAHLEDRLGFNSAWLAFHAAMRLPYVGWSTLSVVECVAWTLGACAVVEGALCRWRRFPPIHQALALAVGVLFLLYALRWGARVVSSTDNAPNIMALLTALYFVECSAHLKAQERSDAMRALLLLVICASLAIAGKLSMAPIALFVLAAVFFATKGPTMLRDTWIPVAAGALFTGIWILRNVLLTGCLAFPVAGTCIDGLTWGMGADRTAAQAATISDWAFGRLSGEVLRDLPPHPLVPRWVQEVLTHKIGIYLLVLLLVGMWVMVRVTWRRAGALAPAIAALRSSEHLLLTGTALLGIGLWAATAPHIRFSWSFLLLSIVPIYTTVFAAVDGGRLVHAGERALKRKPVQWTLAGVVVALVAVRVVQYPQRIEILTLPVVEYRTVKSATSVQHINMPEEGDQCWDTPLPCTPYSRPGLQMQWSAGRPVFRTVSAPN